MFPQGFPKVAEMENPCVEMQRLHSLGRTCPPVTATLHIMYIFEGSPHFLGGEMQMISEKERQVLLRFRVRRAGHRCAGGGRSGRTKGRVLADVLRLVHLRLVLLLVRLHAPLPCWRYVRLLTGRGKRILGQTE